MEYEFKTKNAMIDLSSDGSAPVMTLMNNTNLTWILSDFSDECDGPKWFSTLEMNQQK